MKPIQVRLTDEVLDRLEKLIAEGRYTSKSEAIRDAVRRLLYDK